MSSNSLPLEIAEAIFIHLPVKPLGRFKSVSKTCNSLISDPRFIKNHLQNSTHPKTSKMMLISDTDGSLYSLDTDEILSYFNIPAIAKEIISPVAWKAILGSCNGLILGKDQTDSIFLMNPTTRELLKLPGNPFALSDEKCHVRYGLGYVQSTNDYKVVSMSYRDPNYEYSSNIQGYVLFISIYSLRNNSWRKFHNAPYSGSIDLIISKGVLINQILHWLIVLRPGILVRIVAFNLANEEFGEVNLPDLTGTNRHLFFSDLVNVGGKLCLVLDFRVNDCLWVMEEYGVCESWTKVCMHRLQKVTKSAVYLVGGSNRDIVLTMDFLYTIWIREDSEAQGLRGAQVDLVLKVRISKALNHLNTSSQHHNLLEEK